MAAVVSSEQSEDDEVAGSEGRHRGGQANHAVGIKEFLEDLKSVGRVSNFQPTVAIAAAVITSEHLAFRNSDEIHCCRTSLIERCNVMWSWPVSPVRRAQ